MDRRTFLKGLVATAAGVLVPGAVLAEPERRVWALDSTMARPQLYLHRGQQAEVLRLMQEYDLGMVLRVDEEIMWVGPNTVHLAQAGTIEAFHKEPWAVEIIGVALSQY
jgi:hypothetical protein